MRQYHPRQRVRPQLLRLLSRRPLHYNQVPVHLAPAPANPFWDLAPVQVPAPAPRPQPAPPPLSVQPSRRAFPRPHVRRCQWRPAPRQVLPIPPPLPSLRRVPRRSPPTSGWTRLRLTMARWTSTTRWTTRFCFPRIQTRTSKRVRVGSREVNVFIFVSFDLYM